MTSSSEPAPGPRLSAIGQIAINVRDLDRAVEFYRDRLGLSFLFQAPPGLAFFQCGEVRLMLGIAESAEYDHPASIIYYRVDDITQAHTSLSSRGVEFADAPHLVHKAVDHELWLAFFRDTEGNPLALMAERPA